MMSSSLKRALPWLAIAGVLAAFQALVPGPDRSMFWRGVFDAGHAPLYGLIALVLLQGIRRLTRSWWKAYLAALFLATLLGLLMEVSQYFGDRDADPGDALRNLAGAASFLAVSLTVDRSTPLAHGKRRWLLLAVAAVTISVVFIPVAGLGLAYVQRDAAFPVLCDFEHSWESTFVRGRDADLDRLPAPSVWEVAHGEKAGRIRFLPAIYPALILSEPYPDWSGFDRLVIDAFSEEPEPLRLELRIHDAGHGQEYRDRFNTSLVLIPGVNRITVPLEAVHQAPEGRLMDMKQIRNLTLFRVRPDNPSVVWVDRIRLVPGDQGEMRLRGEDSESIPAGSLQP